MLLAIPPFCIHCPPVLASLPVVRKASWHCRQCHHDYYGERYCTHCQTGGFSLPRTAQQLSCT
ncbi:hypothetical protein E4R24_16635 [Escherichia coli]|nr:hypothetical protein E4R24_16635 [Escherichia coli]